LQLSNWKIEPEAINTDKNQLTCLRIAFWKREFPIFEADPTTDEPQRYALEYEKILEPKLIEAVKQSEIVTAIIENQKIVQIK
jgi:hypothetical protein